MTCNSLAIARPTSQTPLQIFAMEIIRHYPSTEKAIHEALSVVNHYGLKQEANGMMIFSWQDFHITFDKGIWTTTFNGYTGQGRSLVEANEDFDKAYQEYYKLG